MQQKQVTWIFVLIIIGILMIGTFALYAAGIFRPVLSVLQADTFETPAPDQSSSSAVPSPVPASSPKASPKPAQPRSSKAISLQVNGVPVFGLPGKDIAEHLLDEYLSYCAYENLTETEHLIRAYIDAEISVSSYDGSAEYLTYDEAMARLLNTRTIIPVVRSVENAEITTGEIETLVVKQPSLPVGAQLYRSLGKAEHLFSLSETIYKSGIAVSSSQTLSQVRIGSDPSPIAIEEGSYVFTEGGPSPVGKDPGELQLKPPCKGSVLTGFGPSGGKMNYGIDYSLRVGSTLVAPENGTVSFIGERGDYGLVIEIRHDNGFVSRLAHCANPSVELEQHVYRGDPVAILAKQETAEQPYLHYELLIDGIPFDPEQYFQ